ncbi:hypothetical protein CB0940_08214 [Cercospora beticola]|uniref:Uncharacterized protein n=1 Tax=Cercospora beticola TaxID=122368 RepID=A0A2G5HP10_CERBT|nr:hypothetical protein CB0940_08214 [Cercospora beticola]PIA94274.1 hypothetical protein CB0940_08214 [Cercospora beticola]WPB04782.1 hypothetical protein RHO25_009429 [Cercospora beticola]
MYSGMPVKKRDLEERQAPGTIPAFVICDVLLQTTKTIFSTTTAMVTKTIKPPANTVTVTSSLTGTFTTTVPGTNNPTSTIFTSLFKTSIFTITAFGGSTTVTTAFPVTTTSIIPYYAACDGALANGNYVDTVNDVGIGNAQWGVSSSSQQLQDLGTLSVRDCCVAGQANSAGTYWEISSQKCWGVPLGNLPGDVGGGFCSPDITNGDFRLQVGERTPRVVVSNGGCGFVEMREG